MLVFKVGPLLGRYILVYMSDVPFHQMPHLRVLSYKNDNLSRTAIWVEKLLEWGSALELMKPMSWVRIPALLKSYGWRQI